MSMNETEVKELLRSMNPDDQMTGFSRTPIFLAVIFALLVHGAVIGMGFVPWGAITQSIGLSSASTSEEDKNKDKKPEDAKPAAAENNDTADENKTNETNENNASEDPNDPAAIQKRIEDAERRQNEEKEDPDTSPGNNELDGILGL